MGNWDNFKNIKSGAGEILKPEEGKSYKIRIIGEPWVYQSEYNGNVSTRFAITLYNQTDKQAQILLLSKTAFGNIFELVENEDWGDPSEYDITMKRTGSELETKYSFAPSPKSDIEPDKLAEVESIVLEDILSRLPSVSLSFPLSKVDSEQLIPKAKNPIKPSKNFADDVVIEDTDPEMPPDFLK